PPEAAAERAGRKGHPKRTRQRLHAVTAEAAAVTAEASRAQAGCSPSHQLRIKAATAVCRWHTVSSGFFPPLLANACQEQITQRRQYYRYLLAVVRDYGTAEELRQKFVEHFLRGDFKQFATDPAALEPELIELHLLKYCGAALDRQLRAQPKTQNNTA